MRLRLLLPAVVVVAAGAAAAWIVAAGGGDAAPAAQLWVDGNGGDCTRESSAAPYREQDACRSLTAAWAAAQAGDVIRIRAGRYGAQQISGDKAAPTRAIGEDGAVFTAEGVESCGYQGGVLCANADHLVLEHVTLDAGETHGQSNGAEVNGNDVTFRDVALEGPYVSLYVRGEDFTWQGGRLGADGSKGGPRTPPCDNGAGDGEPVWIEESATGATLDGIRFNPQAADPTPRSCSENGFHLETVRIEAAQDVTIRNADFRPDGESASGHVFVTSASPSDTAARGLTITGSTFTPVAGTYGLQVNANVQACPWKITGNTLAQPFLLDCDTAGLVWSDNDGPAGELDAG